MARRHPDPDTRTKNIITTQSSPSSPPPSTSSNATSKSITMRPSSPSRSPMPWNVYRSTRQSYKNSRRCSAFLLIGVVLLLVVILIISGRRDLESKKHNKVDNNLRSQSLITLKNQDIGNPSAIQENDRAKAELDKDLIDAIKEIPLPTDYEELSDFNNELATLDPSIILMWATYQLFHTQQQNQNQNEKLLRHNSSLLRASSSSSSPSSSKTPAPLAQVTSFGPTGLVILQMLSDGMLLREIPVITMDTLHLFPESYEYYDTVKRHFHLVGGNEKNDNMELIVTKPVTKDGDGRIQTRKEFDEIYGNEYWKTQPAKYAEVTKTIPLKKVMEEYQVQMWITGRRRSQGGDRSSMDVLEFEPFSISSEEGEGGDSDSVPPFHPSKGRWKLNPLAYWSYKQVWAFIRQHNIPYNPLYDKGYTSLGDEMTTGLPQTSSGNSKNVVEETEDALERSGRFIGLNRTECGLHAHIEKINLQKQEAMEVGEEWTVPTLVCDQCIDLTVDNFESVISKPPSSPSSGGQQPELLVEFYSPYCGGCQAFAPTLNRVANYLTENISHVRVARFDITEHEIPSVGGKDIFEVEVTPTLYRVRYDPSLEAKRFEGGHYFDSILSWIRDT